MADIPPDIAVSAAQAGFTAREVAREREAGRAGQAHSTDRQIKSLDEAGATVDTDDGDVAVFSDAEGSGSQGRSHPQDESGETADDDSGDTGITRDDQGQLHLDLEA